MSASAVYRIFDALLCTHLSILALQLLLVITVWRPPRIVALLTLFLALRVSGQLLSLSLGIAIV